MRGLSLVLLLPALAGSVSAQSNTVVGLNGRLEVLDNITYWGRRGSAYPGGEVGLSMRNTMCNPGSVSIPWFAQMAENHPKFGFIITRLSNDRMEQISDRSYCKHAFTSASTSGACGPCNGIGGNQMGVTCSDTYSAGHNAGRGNLGPADEIDPWLGTWPHVGSFFDQGLPNVGAPGNTDGLQSPINPPDEVTNRVTVKEADLLVPGASYYYGIQLIHQGEALANRGDNIKSRGMVASGNGGAWSVGNSAVGEAFGSILQHWTGASVDSGSNGTDDGRFFVAVKVTPLGGGQFHFEYAVHNVDNSRGGATLRVPCNPAAVVTNFTFGDIDSNALNDWTGAKVGSEIVFTAPANNPLNWNTIYNFGFNCDIAPGGGAVLLDEARIGAGALQVTVLSQVPGGVPVALATSFGTGCGGTNCQSSFYEFFPTAASFDLANTSITLTYNAVTGNYTAGAGTGSYIAPAGTNLAMGDDVSATAAIPFSLPYPGGSTNTLHVCSNGFVSPAANGSSFTPNASEFLTGAARWAAVWHDLLPATGMVKVDTTAGRAVVSYTAVPNYGTSGTATFQFQFWPNGNVHIIYQAVATAGNAYLAGWTPGGGAADPGSMNISSGFGPGGLVLCSGPTPNLALASSARPVLNTTINLVTSNIPAGSPFGATMLSLTAAVPPTNLTSQGMPGCFGYLTGGVSFLFLAPGTSYSQPWTVPNSTTFTGLVITVQSATFSPPLTPLGAITSNAVTLVLGQI